PNPASDSSGGRTTHYRSVKGPHPLSPPPILGEGSFKPSLSPSPLERKGKGRVTLFPKRKGAGGLGTPGQGGRAQERRLANGMTIIVRENHANPTVAVAGFVRTGSVADPPGKYGLAGIVADMLTRGTTTRTSQQIAEEAD